MEKNCTFDGLKEQLDRYKDEMNEQDYSRCLSLLEVVSKFDFSDFIVTYSVKKGYEWHKDDSMEDGIERNVTVEMILRENKDVYFSFTIYLNDEYDGDDNVTFLIMQSKWKHSYGDVAKLSSLFKRVEDKYKRMFDSPFKPDLYNIYEH